MLDNLDTSLGEILLDGTTLSILGTITCLIVLLSFCVHKSYFTASVTGKATQRDFIVTNVNSICYHGDITECVPCNNRHVRIVVDYTNKENKCNTIHIY